ncbi:MAG: DUF192 domain-containing protein [Pseudomonadota bacterium]
MCRRLCLLVALSILAMFWALGPGWAKSPFDETPLTIQTQQGSVEFRIEIADDPAERSQGLMFRRSMDEDVGMLFVYGQPREITMWMKNTYIPLDMVFIDAQGEVVSISANTIPHSLTTVSSRVPATYVLEINAGLAKQNGLQVGDVVEHPAIR